ncbi:hypothetical protein OG535_37400 [Kitasatospora sp. NBC_00085]|uniref:hypothetical protein n=1 Tax=unclassified Kitasatospora TaxID=2633591 RepID=UPI00324DD714
MRTKHIGRSVRALGASVAVVALAVTGCSSGAAGGAAGAGSSSPTASGTTSPTASAAAAGTTVSAPAPSPSETCFDTSMVGDTTVSGYLARLPGTARIIDPGLFMRLDGLHLDTRTDERPCRPVAVTITRFSVRLAHTGTVPGSQFSFSYTPLDSVGVAVGPANGVAAGSVPPATSHCTGVLSVVHLGEAVREAELPAKFTMVTPNPPPTAPYDQNVTVPGDRIVTAGLALPADAASC